MASVYELSTVRPHQPEGRRYSRAEWSVYCEGYYQALVMALRVMQFAARRWRARPMNDSPKQFVIRSKEPAPPALPDDVRLPLVWRCVIGGLIAVGVAAAAELLIIGALFINRALQ